MRVGAKPSDDHQPVHCSLLLRFRGACIHTWPPPSGRSALRATGFPQAYARR
jgi:hypothetical protein